MKETEMEIPLLFAGVVNQGNLCRFSEGPDCEKQLPEDAYLRLRYRLGWNTVSEYRIRLTVEPRSSVGFAYLRTARVFDVNRGAGRADMIEDTNDVWIASATERGVGTLTRDVDMCVVGRAQRTLGEANATLRASFANDREGKGVVSELEKCWSLRDGVRVECGPRGSEPSP